VKRIINLAGHINSGKLLRILKTLMQYVTSVLVSLRAERNETVKILKNKNMYIILM